MSIYWYYHYYYRPNVLQGQNDLAYTPESSSVLSILGPLTFGLLSSSQVQSDGHLLGQHTVRMSPISTAQLNPYEEAFCLPSTGDVLVPILLNNTNHLVSLRFSVTPLGFNPGQPEFHDLSGKELRAIEKARVEALQLMRPASHEEMDEYDEYDDDPVPNHSSQSLQRTQTLVHIRLSKPGILRLERVLDSSNIEARLVIPLEVTIAPCPRAGFTPDKHADDNIRCSGQETDVQLMMDISGVPPLQLRWSRTVNGRMEKFLVEGIEGGGHSQSHPFSDHSTQMVTTEGFARWAADAEQIQVPLTVSLDTPGSHIYALEEVMDAAGNMMLIGGSIGSTPQNNHAVRSFTVLRRPSISFKHCSPEHPVALAIGSESALTVSTIEADVLDAPWEISLKYQPHLSDKGNKRFKPWRKTLSTPGSRRDLTVGANAPGEYVITGVKGKVNLLYLLVPSKANLCIIVVFW